MLDGVGPFTWRSTIVAGAVRSAADRIAGGVGGAADGVAGGRPRLVERHARAGGGLLALAAGERRERDQPDDCECTDRHRDSFRL